MQRVEADGDIHIALQDASGDGVGTVSAEIPVGPKWCDIRQTVFGWMTQKFPFTVKTAHTLKIGAPHVITVTGKAFYDVGHAPADHSNRRVITAGVNAETPKPNGSGIPPAGNTGHRSRLRRTLFIASVFALLAMIYVPAPAQQHPFSRAHYRFIFSQNETGIAFFQLLLNVTFAALFGAILANIVAKVSKRALYVTAVGIAVVAVFAFREAAIDRAKHDEKNAGELLVLYPRDSEWLTKFRNAVINWRLALRFDEAARVENRIKEIQSSPPPSPGKQY
jgi:hypothetical protein